MPRELLKISSTDGKPRQRCVLRKTHVYLESSARARFYSNPFDLLPRLPTGGRGLIMRGLNDGEPVRENGQNWRLQAASNYASYSAFFSFPSFSLSLRFLKDPLPRHPQILFGLSHTRIYA